MTESSRLYCLWYAHMIGWHGYYHNPPDPTRCPVCAYLKADYVRARDREIVAEQLAKRGDVFQDKKGVEDRIEPPEPEEDDRGGRVEILDDDTRLAPTRTGPPYDG